MSKVWVYVSEKHGPEVYVNYEDAHRALIEDANWGTWSALVEEGYAEGSREQGWEYVDDTGHITEVEVNE